MVQRVAEAAGLIEGLRYVDDTELINDDIVGCAANLSDEGKRWPDPIRDPDA